MSIPETNYIAKARPNCHRSLVLHFSINPVGWMFKLFKKVLLKNARIVPYNFPNLRMEYFSLRTKNLVNFF